MHRHLRLKIVFVILFVLFALYIGVRARDNQYISGFINSFGYIGVFIIAIISGFNLVVPIPTVSFLPLFISSGLNAPLTILIISVGMVIADSIAFIAGKTGRQVMIHHKYQMDLINKLDRYREKNKLLPYLFLMVFSAFVPLPNEIIVVPLSFLGYGYMSIFPFMLFGNLLFNATAGAGLIGLSTFF